MNNLYRYKVIPLFAVMAIPLALLALPSAQAEDVPAQDPAQVFPGGGMGRGAGMGAGGGAGMNPPAFTDFDANGDGCINAEEFSAGWGKRRAGNVNANMPAFADFDTDKDGYISEQELNTGRAQRITERATQGRQMRNVANATPFADIDTSKDGKIDPAEFAAHQAQHRLPQP